MNKHIVMNSRKRYFRLLTACSAAALLMAAPGAHAQVSGGTNTTSTDNVCNQNTSFNQVACGTGSVAASAATAVGAHATATGSASTAVGGESYAFGLEGVAVGTNAEAFTEATALGAYSRADGKFATATGAYATAAGTGDLAAGFSALAGASAAGGSSNNTNGNIALGSDSKTVDGASTAAYTTADGGDSIAIGTASQATNTGGIALGAYAEAAKAHDMALGYSSIASGGDSTALGYGAFAAGDDSTSLGGLSHAASLFSTAVGLDSVALSQSSLAVGAGGYAAGKGDVVAGATSYGAGGNNTNGNIAIGTDSATADGATQVYTRADGGDAIALGTATQATGSHDVAVGATANASGPDATAVGANASAIFLGTALGGNAQVMGNGKAIAGLGLVGNVAIGEGSSDGGDDTRNVVSVGNATTGLTRAVTNVSNGVLSATSTDAVTGQQLYATNQAVAALAASAGGGGGPYLPTAGGTLTGALDMGGNKVTGAAAGTVAAGSTDVVTGQQLYATNQQVAALTTVADNALSTTGGTLTGGLNMGGNTVTDLGSGTIAAGSTDAVNGGDVYGYISSLAFQASSPNPYVAVSGTGALPSVSGNGAVGIGVGQTASGNGAVAIGDPNSATGTGAVAIGADNTASGDGAVALGNGNTAATAGSLAIGSGNSATGAVAVALGTANQAQGDASIALGSYANVNAGATGGVALGNGATVNAGVTNAVALGADSTADASNTVSVGGPLLKRRVTNVAAGTISATSSDAVTGAQVYAQAQSVATALGGGANVAGDGTVTAPSYSLSGQTYNTVGSALSGLSNRIDTLNTQISGLQDTVYQNRSEARGGIASAMAMGYAPLPSKPGRTSWAVNVAGFKGVAAFGFAMAHRVNTDIPLAVSMALSTSERNTSGRIGLSGEF